MRETSVTLTGIDEALATRVRGAASDVVEHYRLPGISIGIVRGDELAFCEGFGTATIESGEPMAPERRHRIASITKTMVGLCLMALVDEGALRLDARVTALLPKVRFDGPAGDITVWHLLTHTSGMGEAPTRDRLRDIANPNRDAAKTPGDFSTLYPDGIVVETPPGTKWAYCNNGYALLGEIIERAERAPLAEVMQRRIWDPLGMAATDLSDEDDGRVTSCYHRAPTTDTRFQLERAGIAVPDETPVDGHNIRGKFTAEFNRAMRAAGGVQSNVPDMARYASALLRRGRGIVRPKTFDAMIAAQHCPDPRLISWGLSFERTPIFGRTAIGHGGAYFGGWNSNLAVFPEENMAIVQHMNVMLDEPRPVFRRIIGAALNAAPASRGQRATEPSLLRAAPGVYELTMPGPLTNFRPATRTGRVTVEAADGELVVRSRWGAWKNGVRLTACDPEDPGFFCIDDADGLRQIAFSRGADGRVKGLRSDDLVYMVRREAR